MIILKHTLLCKITFACFLIQKHDIKSMTCLLVSFKKNLTLLKPNFRETNEKRDLMWVRERSEEKSYWDRFTDLTGNLVKLGGKSTPFSLVTRNQSILDDATSKPSSRITTVKIVWCSAKVNRVFLLRSPKKGRLRNNQDRELACLESFVTAHKPSWIIKFRSMRSSTMIISKYIILKIHTIKIKRNVKC